MSPIFQGFETEETDQEVYAADLHLADLAEPLGFESVWTVEHHFSRYTMVPDVMQFLTWMAARTTKLKLGSMVAVLPWHDPVRLAEQILMLDTMSQGRVILGIGRGTGKIEFDGFSLPMDTARQRFKECAEAVLEAIETGVMAYEGEHVHQPRVELHPAPFASFRDRVFSATISPESAEIMARLGTGILIIPQKPWHLVREDCERYRAIYREAIGEEAPPPIASGWVFVDEDAGRAEEVGRKWLSGYWRSIVDHYEFDKPHLRDTPGYEFHGLMYDRLTAPGGLQKMTDFYCDLQPWGTPEQVLEKIVSFCDLTGADSFVGSFRYGGMPLDEGERNVRLFARTVLPELQRLAPVHERVHFDDAPAPVG